MWTIERIDRGNSVKSFILAKLTATIEGNAEAPYFPLPRKMNATLALNSAHPRSRDRKKEKRPSPSMMCIAVIEFQRDV